MKRADSLECSYGDAHLQGAECSLFNKGIYYNILLGFRNIGRAEEVSSRLSDQKWSAGHRTELVGSQRSGCPCWHEEAACQLGSCPHGCCSRARLQRLCPVPTEGGFFPCISSHCLCSEVEFHRHGKTHISWWKLNGTGAPCASSSGKCSLYLSGLRTTWEEDPNRGWESVSLLCSSFDSYLLRSVLFFVFVSMFSFCPGCHSVFNVQVVDSQNCVERDREHDAGRLPAPAFPHIRVACLLLGTLASTWTDRRWSAVCLWLSKLCHWVYLALLGTDSGFYCKHDCTFCLTPSPTAQLGSFVSGTKGGRYKWFLLWSFVYDSVWVELGPCGTHWCKETVVVAASWAYVAQVS